MDMLLLIFPTASIQFYKMLLDSITVWTTASQVETVDNLRVRRVGRFMCIRRGFRTSKHPTNIAELSQQQCSAPGRVIMVPLPSTA